MLWVHIFVFEDTLCARQCCARSVPCLQSSQPPKESGAIVPILQMRNLKPERSRTCPRAPSLYWGGGSWIQIWMALTPMLSGFVMLEKWHLRPQWSPNVRNSLRFEQSLTAVAYSDGNDLPRKGLCHLHYICLPCTATFSEWRSHGQLRVLILSPHYATSSTADLFRDRSPDLRSHVLTCWECKETGKKNPKIFWP